MNIKVVKGSDTSPSLFNYAQVHIGEKGHTFFNGRICPHCGQAIRNSKFCTAEIDLSEEDARYFYDRVGIEVFEDEPMYARRAACPSCGKLSYDRAPKSHRGRNILRGHSFMIIQCLVGAEIAGAPGLTRSELLERTANRFGDKGPKDSSIRSLLWSLEQDGWLTKAEEKRGNQFPFLLTEKTHAKLKEAEVDVVTAA